MSRDKILSYIKSKKETYILIFLIFLIYGVLFYVNNLDFSTFIYGLVLSLSLIFITSLVALYFYGKKHEAYKDFIRSGLKEESPTSQDPIIDFLARELEGLKDDLGQERAKTKDRQAQLEKLYTIWIHDIKVPLAAINLVLNDQNNKEKIKTELIKIEDSLDRFLAYLKENTGTSDYIFSQVSLDEVIRKSIRKYSSLFISKGLGLDYRPVDIDLITDQKWLSFIIDQILSNSLKYTDQGQIDIYLEENNLIIADSGIGIKSEDLPRIFDMGYTGYNGRIFSKSTGIGLYLVEEICKGLNMDIQVQSMVNKGTRMILKFNKRIIKNKDLTKM